MIRLLYEVSDGVYALKAFEWNQTPEYAILSHTWGNDEVLFHEIYNVSNPSEETKAKSGYKKLEFCAAKAKEQKLTYFWCDTCCIDKSSSAELTEAINSMFEWYKNARVCYAYLADVPDTGGPSTLPFRRSRWFTRGWTLQELIAPSRVEFYNFFGAFIGERSDLAEGLTKLTDIPINTLLGTHELSSFSIAVRIKWATKRTTKRREDGAYSLFGLLNASIGSNYGEGIEAFERLYHRLVRPSPTGRGAERRDPNQDDMREIWEALQEVQESQAEYHSTQADMHALTTPKNEDYHFAVMSMCRSDVKELMQLLGKTDASTYRWREKNLHFNILCGFDEIQGSGSQHDNLWKIAQQLCDPYNAGMVYDGVIFVYPHFIPSSRHSTERYMHLMHEIVGEQLKVRAAILRPAKSDSDACRYNWVYRSGGFERQTTIESRHNMTTSWLDGSRKTRNDFLSALTAQRQPTVLQIQTEIVDHNKPLSATCANQYQYTESVKRTTDSFQDEIYYESYQNFALTTSALKQERGSRRFFESEVRRYQQLCHSLEDKYEKSQHDVSALRVMRAERENQLDKLCKQYQHIQDTHQATLDETRAQDERRYKSELKMRDAEIARLTQRLKLITTTQQETAERAESETGRGKEARKQSELAIGRKK